MNRIFVTEKPPQSTFSAAACCFFNSETQFVLQFCHNNQGLQKKKTVLTTCGKISLKCCLIFYFMLLTHCNIVSVTADQKSAQSQPECLHRQRLLLALPPHLQNLFGSLPQPPLGCLLLTLLLLALAGLEHNNTQSAAAKQRHGVPESS